MFESMVALGEGSNRGDGSPVEKNDTGLSSFTGAAVLVWDADKLEWGVLFAKCARIPNVDEDHQMTREGSAGHQADFKVCNSESTDTNGRHQGGNLRVVAFP